MHILAGLLTLATVVSVIVYRLYILSQSPVGRGLSDAAGGVQKHMRRRAWQKKLGDPLRDVDDPRLAAAAMMVALAQNDSPLSEREEAVITAQMQSRFDADGTLAAELLAHARWLVKDVTDPETCFMKVRPIVQKACGPKERAELIEMMSAVAEVGNDLDSQRTIVAKLAHTLKS